MYYAKKVGQDELKNVYLNAFLSTNYIRTYLNTNLKNEKLKIGDSTVWEQGPML